MNKKTVPVLWDVIYTHDFPLLRLWFLLMHVCFIVFPRRCKRNRLTTSIVVLNFTGISISF